LFPLIQDQANSHFEISVKDNLSVIEIPSDESIAILKAIAGFFTSGDEGMAIFHSAKCRAFRKSLNPFVHNLNSGDEGDKCTKISLSARISNAFHRRDWNLALMLLYEISKSDEIVKLGALQRWVRDCDLPNHSTHASDSSDAIDSASDDEDRKRVSMLLLDAVMRVGIASTRVSVSSNNLGKLKPDLFKRIPSISFTPVVRFHTAYVAPSCSQLGALTASDGDDDDDVDDDISIRSEEEIDEMYEHGINLDQFQYLREI
jgi:hypothetical protein